MALDDIARRIESVVSTASIAGRTLLSLDTNPVPAEWTHITKVDPERKKKIPLFFPAYLSETSAVSVGGSRDVTEANTEATFELLTAADVPAFHEPSASTHVTEKTRDMARFMAVPEVLNGDAESLVGTLGEGIEHIRDEMGPSIVQDKLGIPVDIFGDRVGNFAAAYMLEESVFEAYIIMNLDSAAAREANVGEDDLLTPQEAKQRALAAEYHLESELVYLEYSGTFGGEEAEAMLEAIDDGVSWSRIWYGGGLDSRENVNRVLNAGADAVVVGDVFHDVAEEEARLYERAQEAFETVPDAEELRGWIEAEIDVPETAAMRYLSTIPAVTQPELLAAQYLTSGVRFALAVRDIAEDFDDPSESAIRERVAEESLPGTFEGATNGSPTEVKRKLAMTLLGAHFNLEAPYPGEHLALEI